MDFEHLASSEWFNPAPSSSSVVVADVRGSTKLVQNGRQRDVNLVGAACIAAIRNLFPRGRVPYVFGGDGATFLVNDVDLPLCLRALEGVGDRAWSRLGIRLRVGAVSMDEIRSHGLDVRYGSVASGPGEDAIFLRGEGIALADRLVKERSNQPASSTEPNVKTNISGLSCRLLPFVTKRGIIASWVIEPSLTGTSQDPLFQEIFSRLKKDGPLARFCPVHADQVRHRWLSPQWRSEGRLHSSDASKVSQVMSMLRALIQSLLTRYVFKFNKANATTGLPSRYISEVPNQSDWIKTNGGLYLILDMTHEEYSDFKKWLSVKEKEGALTFGVHSSSGALVTCHLHSSSEYRHFHFVDGAGGGLTAAAVQLKAKKTRLIDVLNPQTRHPEQPKQAS